MSNFPSLEEVLGLSYKSLWEPDRLYLKNDVVEYFSNFYVCINTNNGAVLSDTNSWVLLKDHPSISDSLGIANTATPNTKGLIRSNLAVATGVPIAVTQPVAFTPPPPVSEWTWANQGTAVAYNDPAGIKFVIGPDDTTQFCLFILGDIPDSPYTITIAGTGSMGIVLLDPVSGNLKISSLGNISYLDDPVTYNSAAANINTLLTSGGLSSNTSWFRLQDDGTNLLASTSADGLFFNTYTIAPNTDFVVPTKYGVFVQGVPTWPNAPQICQPYLLSFEITTP